MEWVFGRMFGLAGGIAKESTGNPVACQQPVADPSSVPSSSPQRASMQSPPTDEVAARAEERRTSGPPPGAGGANLHSSREAPSDCDASSLDGSSIQEDDDGLEGAGGPMLQPVTCLLDLLLPPLTSPWLRGRLRKASDPRTKL